MVLLELLGVALGAGLINSAAKQHGKKANPNLNTSRFDADNARHGIASHEAGYTEQRIMDIAARCGVRPNKYGVLPENGYKHCLKYVAKYVNHPDDVDIFERDWRKTISKQLTRKAAQLKSESEKHYEYLYRQWYLEGMKEKCEKGGNTIVLTFKHWHGMPKDQHLGRMENLVENTLWGDRIAEQPILRHNPRFEDSHIETWVVKAVPSAKQDSRITHNGLTLAYKTCCKHLGYDPML